MSRYCLALVFVLYMVKEAECGECCKPHYSLTVSEQSEKWCPNYCCFNLPNLYDCCDDIHLRAPEDSREDFCLAFFTSNVWAPIIAAVGTILLIVGCCVCCCKYCCGRGRSHGVIVQTQQQPSLVVMSQQSTTVNQAAAAPTPYNAGYNQVPTNPYSAGYDQPPKYN